MCTKELSQLESLQARVQELERAMCDIFKNARCVTGESEFDTDDLLDFAEMVKERLESLLVD